MAPAHTSGLFAGIKYPSARTRFGINLVVFPDRLEKSRGRAITWKSSTPPIAIPSVYRPDDGQQMQPQRRREPAAALCVLCGSVRDGRCRYRV